MYFITKNNLFLFFSDTNLDNITVKLWRTKIGSVYCFHIRDNIMSRKQDTSKLIYAVLHTQNIQ